MTKRQKKKENEQKKNKNNNKRCNNISADTLHSKQKLNNADAVFAFANILAMYRCA